MTTTVAARPKTGRRRNSMRLSNTIVAWRQHNVSTRTP
jgi:hypothetical protein